MSQIARSAGRNTRAYLGNKFQSQKQVFDYLTSEQPAQRASATQFYSAMTRLSKLAKGEANATGRCPRLAGKAATQQQAQQEARMAGASSQLITVTQDAYGNPLTNLQTLVHVQLSMDAYNKVHGATHSIDETIAEQWRDEKTGQVDKQLILEEFTSSFISAFNDARRKVHAVKFSEISKDETLSSLVPENALLGQHAVDFEHAAEANRKFDYRLNPDEFDLRFFSGHEIFEKFDMIAQQIAQYAQTPVEQRPAAFDFASEEDWANVEKQFDAYVNSASSEAQKKARLQALGGSFENYKAKITEGFGPLSEELRQYNREMPPLSTLQFNNVHDLLLLAERNEWFGRVTKVTEQDAQVFRGALTEVVVNKRNTDMREVMKQHKEQQDERELVRLEAADKKQ